MTKCKNLTKLSRKSIPDAIRLRLWVRSGGRCSLCNKPVYQNNFTLQEGTFGDLAHITAQTENGPRGNANSSSYAVDYENLLLLCKEDHKLVDDDANKYTTKILRKLKKDHEERIRLLTDININAKTYVLTIQSNIGATAVSINIEDVKWALFKNKKYPHEDNPYMIDLTNDQPSRTKSYYSRKIKEIDDSLDYFLSKYNHLDKKSHISIFPLALMPLLVYTGKKIGDKHEIDLYQFHRNTNNWIWKNTTNYQKYATITPYSIDKNKEVYLIVSLSDYIKEDKYKPLTKESCNIYEITIDNPNPNYLINKKQISEFQSIYRDVLNKIQAVHGKRTPINIMMAVPCPIAVQMGLSLLDKDPRIHFYDYNSDSGFIKALTL